MKKHIRFAVALTACAVFGYRFLANENAQKATESEAKALASARECKQRRYKLFQELYLNEEKRRDSLIGTFSFLLGAAGLCGSFLSFYFRELYDWFSSTPFSKLVLDWSAMTYVTGLAFGLIFLVGVIACLVLAIHNHEYRFPPTPHELHKYYADLEGYHGATEPAEDEFLLFLTNEYANAADHNESRSIKRRKYIYVCIKFLNPSMICLGMVFIPYSVHKMRPAVKPPLAVTWQNAHMVIDQPQGKSENFVFDKNYRPLQSAQGIPSNNGKSAESTAAKTSATEIAGSPDCNPRHGPAITASETLAPSFACPKDKFLWQGKTQEPWLNLVTLAIMPDPKSKATPTKPTTLPPTPPSPRYIKEGSEKSTPRPQTNAGGKQDPR